MKTEQTKIEIRSRLLARPEQLGKGKEADEPPGSESYFLLPTPQVSEGLKITPAGRPATRSLWSKGDRTKRTAEHKKKTMKTTAQKKEKNGLLSRSEQSGFESRPQIDFARRRANRALETEKLLALLRSDAPRFYEIAEVVGKWVWVQFSDKQPPTITRVLAELGFHWNNARQVWQHPCGTIRRERATFNPRKRYRSYFAADVKFA
jgi:hypothetical protein